MVRTRVQPSPGAELLREGAGRLRRAAARMVPREVLVAWALSRIYSGALITAAARSGRPGPATGGFSKWDGWWYLMIGRFGYGRPPAGALPTRWPFFPLLPGVIGGIRHLGIPHRGGIVVVNHLVFLVALAGVWRIARRHSGGAAPRLAVWALAFFPLSFVFSMVYPSSIFLAASVWAFVFVDERRDLAAGVAAAAAAMVRPNGLTVALALAFAVGLRSRQRLARVCGPALLALALWCLMCWHWTGDPFVFLTTKHGWREVTIVELLRHPTGHPTVYPHLALAGLAVAALLARRSQVPRSWSFFTALDLVPSLGLGMVGLGRYANECFPPFVGAGALLERARRSTRAVVLALSAGGQALAVWWIIHLHHVP